MRANSHLGLGAFLLFVCTLTLTAVLSVIPSRDAEARGSTIYLRPGSTINDVAFQWKTTPETIRWLNDMDADDLVFGGQAVRVPPRDGMIAVLVKPGDSPATLARRNHVPLAMIVDLNKVGPNKKLKPGERLYVLSKSGLFASEELPFHVVRPGDSLESIAEKYNSSPSLIIRFNELESGGKLTMGQRLVVPPESPQVRLGEAPRDAAGIPKLSIVDFPTYTERWIDVDLSEQRVIAYQGTRPVRSFLVSTGKDRTPTLKGVFRVESKVPVTRMIGGSQETGDYYNLGNVQWVSYFYGGYSFHGTYWHHNFGHPMSHGCVNMTNADAKWLYEWTTPTYTGKARHYTTEEETGTLVVVHN